MGSTRTNKAKPKRSRDKTARQDSFATLVDKAAAVSPQDSLAAAPPANASSTSGVQGALLALTRGGV